MSDSKANLYELHNQNKEWINALAFFKDEVNFLENRLKEIAGKYTDHDLLAQCDSFFNRLTIQKSEIHRLKEAIKGKETLLGAEITHNPVAVDHREFAPEEREREAMENFESIYHDLRKDLISFFAKWM